MILDIISPARVSIYINDIGHEAKSDIIYAYY